MHDNNRTAPNMLHDNNRTAPNIVSPELRWSESFVIYGYTMDELARENILRDYMLIVSVEIALDFYITLARVHSSCHDQYTSIVDRNRINTVSQS